MIYKSTIIMPWYIFTPSSSPGIPCDPSEYTLITGVPVCPGVNNRLCGIQASDNSGHPIITFSLCSEIATALTNKIDTVNVRLKP